MAETDVFERRLRAALVRHVADGPTEFDALGFARLVAATEPRRHGLGAVLGWRRVGVPGVAWVLFLVALLTVAAAGALIVGSQQQRKLPVVVPPIGQRYECPAGSTPDAPGPVNQARPRDSTPSMAFDRRAGRFVALAGTDVGEETWTFDVCTNTWSRMHPDREPPPGSGRLLYDVDSDLTIASDGAGGIWAYDLEADAWTQKSAAPVGANRAPLSWAYDPLSGVVIAVDARELWSYDVDTDAWTMIAKAPWSDWGALAYDTSVDRLVAYTRSAAWLLDLRTGVWSRSGAATPEVYNLWGMARLPPPIVYDEAAERTVVFSAYGGLRIAAYDATTDRWDVLVDVPDRLDQVPPLLPGRPENLWDSGTYDAVNGRLVGCGVFQDSGPDGRTVRATDVLALDPLTGEWTVLLEPGPTQSAPSSE